MSAPKELDELLQLVEKFCTGEQVQELLREKKGDEHVRISAETKANLIHRNLRDAVVHQSIDISRVYDLLRFAEENGNQHVFYFRAKSRSVADQLTPEWVAQQLWGSKWKEHTAQFPALRLKPNNYVYSDFRSLAKKPRDWVLKIYGENTVSRFTGKTERRGSSLWREYVDEALRIVLLVRWNSPDLLEIRVQRDESRKRIEAWYEQTWKLLSPALLERQFDPWELKKAISRLILEHDRYPKVYTFRDASIDDMGVLASFQAYSDEGDLFASERSIEAMKTYIKADSECKALAVTWLARPTSSPQKDVRTLIGSKMLHELLVPGHCSPGDLDYVTDQLRSFNKAAS